MKTGTIKAQKYREASSFFFLSPRKASCSSVERAARLEGPFGGSAKYFNVALCPGENVPDQRFAVAGGQVVDLADGQFPAPDVQVGQLAHVGLRGVEAAA